MSDCLGRRPLLSERESKQKGSATPGCRSIGEGMSEYWRKDTGISGKGCRSIGEAMPGAGHVRRQKGGLLRAPPVPRHFGVVRQARHRSPYVICSVVFLFLR